MLMELLACHRHGAASGQEHHIAGQAGSYSSVQQPGAFGCCDCLYLRDELASPGTFAGQVTPGAQT